MSIDARGDLIGGRFHSPSGEAFSSLNPALDHQPVLSTAGEAARAREAAAAAAEAWPAWSALSLDERWAHLTRFREVLVSQKASLAEAITLEMGKIASEAAVEAQALVSRFALVEAQVRGGLTGGALDGFPGEALRYRPHGVVAVLGPFNFPLHLCNAHVLPALLLGNTVVMKPSEVTPLAGQRYAEAALEAGLPPGVFNVVQGGGAVGAALVAAPEVRGLAFTGSWATGRRIAEATLDRPELLLALEMGGKNVCVVREDAEIRQAVHELVISGYLTTGQRCTCSDRVLVHRSRIEELSEALRGVLAGLTLGDPLDPKSFAGPLANRAAHERFERTLERARASGKVEVLVEGGSPGGGAFVRPSLHRLETGAHIEGYTDEEMFGPDLSLEVFEDDAEAIARLNQSPYGFAHSVFTADTDAFERYSTQLETGILNLNRSTNKASPRLPFGGRKRSGNFRPAGAWAGRNLVVPLAEIRQGDGVFDRNAKIVPHLPAVDLDRLEARHAREEAEETSRTLNEHPRPQGFRLPEGGRLPRSEHWHERFYAGDRFVRGEKKPLVVDHLRTAGPWMVSVDDAPMSVLDGMSQTATLPGGFAPDATVRAYAEGDFATALLQSDDTTRGDEPHTQAYAETLRALCPGFPTVSFVNSGAEANEKAYALAMTQAPDKKKLVAFEGSFHGRTLLALYASFNPTKREPFEIAGYEVSFAKSPLETPVAEDGPDPEGWRELWGAGDVEGAQARFGEDPALAVEVASLVDVASRLEDAFAVVVEPMQSEGGDRYLTSRWHRALRLLTRARGVSLIVDEVQCGFGLGGSFLWHQGFGYVDAAGAPDHPDCVCFAKRAQVGVCLSRYEDPEPSHAFPASLARGRLHALSIGSGEDAARVEALVRPRLEALHARWSHRIETPRARGFALAFDLESTAELMRYLKQRFWRGAVVFGAGSRTVRYRLSAAWDEATIEALFETMQRTLAWLEAHPGKTPPKWEDFDEGAAHTRELPDDVIVRIAGGEEREAVLDAIVALEERTYEAARRDSREWLSMAFEEGGVAVVAEQAGQVIGSALGAPLERVERVEGPDRDPFLGKNNTLYSLAVTVDPERRGIGLGRALKTAQLACARAMTTADGAPRYRHVTARNRVPEASSMARLSNSLGAYTVALLEGQYGEGGVARYYRQPLGAFVAGPHAAETEGPDLSAGLVRPLSAPPESLQAYADAGGLYGPAVTKLTVLNYLTPAIVRACEWVGALTPELPHAYLCSSRDETFDKAIRVLRWHRKAASVVVGFEGAYVGHTTAAARSLSCPSTHRQGPAYFDWPRVPHPADGVEASIEALRAVIGERADDMLGVVISPVQERTGRVVPDAFWPALSALRDETGVPVVLVETPCAHYRSGRGPFASSALDFTPDVMTWWTGGQLGFVHVTSPYRVAKPLTLVSTWDGDELSLVQAHHQLRAARNIDVSAASEALTEALDVPGLVARGLGAYRVLDPGPQGDAVIAALGEAGLRSRALPNGRVVIAPPLDRAEELAPVIGEALRRAFAGVVAD